MSATPIDRPEPDSKNRVQVVPEQSACTEPATVLELESTQTEEIPKSIGRFQPIRQVGCGGFGLVYAAYDPLLRREVAVKVPRSTFLANEKLVERFIREVQAAGSLDHPNILGIVDAGCDGNIPYLVSPLCAGPDLARWLSEQRPNRLPVKVAVYWIEQLAEAVNHAHRRGFIHRDIKPSNILLETGGQQDPALWIPKLTDFGLAKALNDDSLEPLTRTGDTLGTPEYMAPEQVAGDSSDVGIGTDIHGLGIVLHELLFGKSPYSGSSRAALMLRIINESPSFQSSQLAAIPADLRAILGKCLEKKPEDRYATAGDLADDLRRFQQGMPTKVRPLTLFQHGWRLSKKYPQIAALSSVMLLLLILFMVSVIRYESSLRDSLVEAQIAKKTAVERADLLTNRIRVSDLNQAYELLAEGKQDLSLDVLNNLQGYEPDLAQLILKRLIWDRPFVLLNTDSDLVTNLQATSDGKHILAMLGQHRMRAWNVNTGMEQTIFKQLGKMKVAHNHLSNGWICMLINDNEMGIYDCRKDFQEIKRYPFPSNYSLKEYGGLYAHAWSDNYGVITDHVQGIFLKHPHQENLIHLTLPRKESDGYLPWLSPDGLWLVLTRANQPMQLWSLPEGVYQGELQVPSSGIPLHISFAQDGEHCFIGTHDGTLYQVQLGTRQIVKQAVGLLHHMQSYNTREMNFKPLWSDEKRQIWYTGRLNGEVSVIDLNKLTETSLCKHQSSVLLLETAGPGKLLTSDQHELKLVDVETKKVIRSWVIPESLAANKGNALLRNVAYFPERPLVALGNQSGNIALWKLDYQPPEEMFHSRSGAFTVSFSPDSSFLASGGDDWCVQLWNVRTRKLIRKLKGHINLVEAVAFSSDGKWLVSGSYDKKVKLWSVETGECIRTFTGASSVIRSVAITPDGRQIIAGCRATTKTSQFAPVLFWNNDSTDPVRTIHAHQSDVRSLLISADGKTLLSGGEDRTIKLWDVSTGSLLKTVDAMQQIWQMTIHGHLLVTSGNERFITIWDMNTWSPVRQFFDPDTHHRGLVISHDGKTIVSGGENGPIRFWQTTTGLQLGKLPLDKDGVIRLAISPDGKHLAAACKSGKVRLYSTE